jgi:hypothetical protein
VIGNHYSNQQYIIKVSILFLTSHPRQKIYVEIQMRKGETFRTGWWQRADFLIDLHHPIQELIPSLRSSFVFSFRTVPLQIIFGQFHAQPLSSPSKLFLGFCGNLRMSHEHDS